MRNKLHKTTQQRNTPKRVKTKTTSDPEIRREYDRLKHLCITFPFPISIRIEVQETKK